MATITEAYLTDVKHVKDYIRTDSGDLETISGVDNVKEAIFRRIMTTRGSIVHRPDYGVGIKDYQNAPSSITNKRKLALEIQDQIEQDPRVREVLGVSFNTTDKTPEKYELSVRVELIGYGETDISFIPFGE